MDNGHLVLSIDQRKARVVCPDENGVRKEANATRPSNAIHRTSVLQWAKRNGCSAGTYRQDPPSSVSGLVWFCSLPMKPTNISQISEIVSCSIWALG